MNESRFQTQLKKSLVSKGFLVWVIADAFTSGIPDLFIAKDGKAQWLELKVIDCDDDEKVIHLADEKSSARGFERAQVIKLYELNQVGIESFGVCYLANEGYSVRVDYDIMDESKKYKDIKKLPRFDY